MDAVAVTDHGNMFGAYELQTSALEAGIKPILGVEAYIAPGSRFDRESVRTFDGEGNNYHLTLLVETPDGYRNLARLVSEAFLTGFYYKPRMDWELLEKYHEGIIALSGCLNSEVSKRLRMGDYDGREEDGPQVPRPLRGGPLLHRGHGSRPPGAAADPAGPPPAFAETGIPPVATNDAHYLTRDDAAAQDVLLCIGMGKTLNDAKRMKFYNSEFYVKNPEEMASVFRPLTLEAVTNTAAIAERVTPERHRGHGAQDPDVPRPGRRPDARGVPRGPRAGGARAAARASARGVRERRPRRSPRQEYDERLAWELSVIRKMGLSSYFLIVWDFIKYAKDERHPGGPGAGERGGLARRVTRSRSPTSTRSRYDLLFERFLNPDRISMPDIDVDLCERRRGEVIEYVRAEVRPRERGPDHHVQLDEGAGRHPRRRPRPRRAARRGEPALLDDPGEPGQADDARRGAARREGAGGGAERQRDVPAPLRPGRAARRRLAPRGRPRGGRPHRPEAPRRVPAALPQQQRRDHDPVRDEVGRPDGPPEDGLPRAHHADDPRRRPALRGEEDGTTPGPATRFRSTTPRSTGSSRTGGRTASSSSSRPGMRDLLRRVRPERVRRPRAPSTRSTGRARSTPGPWRSTSSGAAGTKFDYPLPQLEPILKDTYGVLVYQEQVMLAARAVAGYSPGEADKLRKAIGKKDEALLKAEGDKFVKKAVANGTPKRKAEELWALILPFGRYGFNKSHSVVYALLAYQTAWMKVHHPVEFLAATLTANSGKSDDVVKYVNTCREMKIPVLPPDVNASDLSFTPDGRGDPVRPRRRQGRGGGRRRLDPRGARGRRPVPVADGFLLARRPPPEQPEGHRGARSSRARSTRSGRAGPRFSTGSTSAIDVAADAPRGRVVRRRTSSSTSPTETQVDDRFPDLPEWSADEKIRYEKETLGFYITGHPLARFEEEIRLFGDVTRRDAREQLDQQVRLVGLVAAVKKSQIKKGQNEGKMMAKAVVEDLTGSVPVTVFASLLERVGSWLAPGRPVLVTGTVRLSMAPGGATHDPSENESAGMPIEIIAREIQPLEGLREQSAREILIAPSNFETLDEAGDGRDPPKVTPARFPSRSRCDAPVTSRRRSDCLRDSGCEPTPEFTASMETLLGPNSVRYPYAASP